MNVFISTTYASLDTPVTSVLSELLEHGVISVELGSTHCFEDNVIEKLKDSSFTYLVHNYFPPPVNPFVVNLASTNEEIRNRSIQHAKDCISAAAVLGARLYTYHPGFISDPIGRSTNIVNYDFIVADTTNSKDESFISVNVGFANNLSSIIAIFAAPNGPINGSPDNVIAALAAIIAIISESFS